MDFVLFIELAENVLGSNLTWDTSTDGGELGTGNATASNILPSNAQPLNPAQQLISKDPYFSGDYMDVGGETITISSRPTSIGNMNVNHPSALNALLVGHYSHPNNPGSDANFHIVEGETEYHPAGTVRIIRARGRQNGPSARLDIIGQVKPQLTGGLDGTDTAVYQPIPAFVEVDFGSLGRYSVPVTPNVGLGVDGGLIVGGLGGGTGDIGTWRFTLRGDAANALDLRDSTVIRAATDTIIPAEMTGSATNVASHTVPMDTRVTVPVVGPVAPDALAAAVTAAQAAVGEAQVAADAANAALANALDALTAAQLALVVANTVSGDVPAAIADLAAAQAALTAAQEAQVDAVGALEGVQDDLAVATLAVAGITLPTDAQEAAAALIPATVESVTAALDSATEAANAVAGLGGPLADQLRADVVELTADLAELAAVAPVPATPAPATPAPATPAPATPAPATPAPATPAPATPAPATPAPATPAPATPAPAAIPGVANFTGDIGDLQNLQTVAVNSSRPGRARLDFVVTDVPRNLFTGTGDAFGDTGAGLGEQVGLIGVANAPNTIGVGDEVAVDRFSITFTNGTGDDIRTFGVDNAQIVAQETLAPDGVTSTGARQDVVWVLFSIRDQGEATDVSDPNLVPGASTAQMRVAHPAGLGFTVIGEWDLTGDGSLNDAQDVQITPAAN
jgi:hypothetical protein